MTHPLDRPLSTFYRRWHLLEKKLGAKGGLVIDFDMDPQRVESKPFAHRSEALDTLLRLREQVAGAEGLSNPVFLLAKLDGAQAYMRALMGQRIPFDRYLRDTMGVAPDPVSRSQLRDWAEQLERGFSELGIGFSREHHAAFTAHFRRGFDEGFEPELRGHAGRLVARILAFLGDVPEPGYQVKVVEADAYWANWIDGSVEQGVTLQVNTHPRIEYRKQSPLQLAAHEIAGHAVHVGALRRSAARGQVQPWAMNLAVHSCEAFQMEGLAQVAMRLLSEGVEMTEELRLVELYRDYSGAVMNRAQLELEAGEPVERVLQRCMDQLPFSGPLSMRSSLRDRGASHLYRSYIHVYAPSRRLFQRACALPLERRRAFFRAAYTHLYTPTQLEGLLAQPESPPA